MKFEKLPLSFCWVFRDATPEEGLPRLKSYGFEGIELWPPALAEFGAQRWAEALRADGLECFQLCPYFDFVHGEEAVIRSRALRDEWLAHAETLGCSRMRVFTGPPWGEGVVGAAEASEEQWQSAIHELQHYCDYAPGIEWCLECHEGSLMEDSPSALRLIRGVDRPNLTVNLQIPFEGEPWRESVKALGPFTTHIHIHNWSEGCGVGKLTSLSEGNFDWSPALRTLLDAGRTVCLSIEHGDHLGKSDPWETARKDGPWLQRLRTELLTEIE